MQADRVREIRRVLELTQGELAGLIGVHALTVSKWERGVLEPREHDAALMRQYQRAAGRVSGIGRYALTIRAELGIAAAIYSLLFAAYHGTIPTWSTP